MARNVTETSSTRVGARCVAILRITSQTRPCGLGIPGIGRIGYGFITPHKGILRFWAIWGDLGHTRPITGNFDTLLGSAKGFLFGKSLADAEAWGNTPDERKLMRWNAKTQVTFWEYPQPIANDSAATYRKSNLQDYACTYSEGSVTVINSDSCTCLI